MMCHRVHILDDILIVMNRRVPYNAGSFGGMALLHVVRWLASWLVSYLDSQSVTQLVRWLVV
jgi:hypothetical protein